jgi:hypothetical protein
MNDYFDRKSPRILHHGVIAYMPSRIPGIFSFLVTGALFAAALLLLVQAFASEPDESFILTTIWSTIS